MHRWLTTTEAAAVAGVCRATMWSWVHRGIVPRQSVLVVGRNRRVDREWCEQMAKAPTTAPATVPAREHLEAIPCA